jgi:serine O-acetyltransferase
MITSFRMAKQYIKADYEKINGTISFRGVITSLMFEPGFKYIFWMRLTQCYWIKKGVYLPLFIICRFILKHYSYKFNYDVSYRAEIAPGFSISHHGVLIIRAANKIGKNCWVRPGTCIGKKSVEDNGDGAVIGDNVQIGFGVCIFGNVHIGDNVSIGGNSVVVKDIPSNCVAAGAPAKIIKRL